LSFPLRWLGYHKKVFVFMLCLFSIKIIYSIDLLQFLMFPEKISLKHYSRSLVLPSVRPSVHPICVRPITSLFEVRFRNYFTEMTTMLTMWRAQHLDPYLEGQGHWVILQHNHVRLSLLCYLKVFFKIYFTEMITILRRRVTRKFRFLLWRSRSQYDFAAKYCPAN